MSQTVTTSDPGGDFGASRNKLGMWFFLCGDAMMFAALFAGYAMVRAANFEEWPVPSEELPIGLTMIFTIVLIISSYTIAKAFHAADREDPYWVKVWLGATVLCGLGFLGFQIYEWTSLISYGNTPALPGAEGLFYSTFYVLTGFHGIHVLGGTIYNSVVLFNFWNGKYAPGETESIEIAGLYWHLVDLIWIVLFTVVYLI